MAPPDSHLHQALSDWDRRNFRHDRSWRMDWKSADGLPAGVRDNFGCGDDLFERGRAAAFAELGLPAHHSGGCQDGRALAGAELGVPAHPSAVSHGDRASAVQGEQRHQDRAPALLPCGDGGNRAWHRKRSFWWTRAWARSIC